MRQSVAMMMVVWTVETMTMMRLVAGCPVTGHCVGVVAILQSEWGTLGP